MTCGGGVVAMRWVCVLVALGLGRGVEPSRRELLLPIHRLGLANRLRILASGGCTERAIRSGLSD
jgi:hypothetical protein